MPRTRNHAAPVAQSLRRGERTRGSILVTATLVIGLVAWLLPFAWMLLGSIKPQGEILRRPPTFWPEEATWQNYATWFADLDFPRFFTNSLIVAVVTVLGNLVFCSMVGYALAKMSFQGKKLLFGLVMLTLMVPGVVTFVPLFVQTAQLGLLDTYAALVLPFITTPVGVFLMRQFIGGLPDELLEAARIDGAGELRLFVRVVLPLCGPALATLAILTFLSSWNNFLWPLVVSQSADLYTLPVALSLYSTGQHSTNYGLLLAGSVLVITPILLLFALLQRWFIQGIATTGLK